MILLIELKDILGSDLINICKEAAMMPIRRVEDTTNCKLEYLKFWKLNLKTRMNNSFKGLNKLP